MFDLNEQFALNGALFTMELFNHIANEKVTENVLFSPFSIQACMALAFAGAQGETADEITNKMAYVSDSQPEVGGTFKYVLDKYKVSEQLKLANKVYVHKNYKIKFSYEQTLKELYYSEAEALNFDDSEDSANLINSWVKSKTGGKIKDLISSNVLNNMTRLVLLSAIHFKGNWTSKFDEKLTAEDDFWMGKTESVKIEYMHQIAEFGFGYFSDLDCTALEITYKDSDLSMFVLLPNERDGLKALAEKLKVVNLVGLAGKMNSQIVEVRFPKFKMDASMELKEVLKKLGLKKIFENPDFSNMLEPAQELVVSTIVHKACIEVNEEGTEASAATGMVILMRSMPTHFIADHPFLYFIWNKKNILFVGAFVEPPKN